jgi:endonuclease YncB( thermonuclease family)
LRGRVVQCIGDERDAHGRLLAICRSQGQEVNRWLVEQGWAVSYHDYPAAERAARTAKRGIWSGSFVRPHDWREENR